ncbi:thiol reductant ABC exporter subunit CydD [Halovibrio salipaludis]|uniref:thiol reductant ABC exporter subunit CydD n=1 Tax=Halovibrio salipaludis TaxID=2032626 RepID=UPI001E48EBD8|nr:thiol reductant ABC exporter subunit CydD [Halovibrio salipaludis]
MTATTEPRLARQWLTRWAAPVRAALVLAVVAGVVQALALIAQLGVMAWFVDRLILSGASPAFGLTAAALMLAVAVRAGAQWLQDRAGLVAGDRVRSRVRQALLGAWEAAGPVGLAGSDSARLASEWTEQVDALEGYYARFLPQMVLAVVVPALILLVVAWLDWLAALFLLAAAPLIPLFMALVGMGAERVNRQHYESLARLSGHFLDRLRGLTTLQLFGQTRAAVADVARATDDYRQLNMATLRVAFLSSAVLEFFASVAIAAVAMYVGFGLLEMITFGPASQMTLFSGLFALLLAPEFFQPLRLLSQYYHDRAAALGAAAHLGARLSVPVAGSGAADITTPCDRDGIRVADLAVAWPGRAPVFRGLQLQVPAGQTLVVTGPSGSGKSTLMAVLAGFLVPQEGAVRVAGQPAGCVQVGWMGQRPWLVHGSWRDNLQAMAPEADDEAMHRVLEEVGLGTVLSARPEGLDAPLGEEGLGLSGGQARRLAFARLLLMPAPVLLLDEPTAGLDAATEAEVIAALRRVLAAGRTCVIATHQPAIMALADQVFTLGGGNGDE